MNKQLILKLKINNLKFARSRASFLPVVLMVATLFIAYASALISISMANLKTADLHNKKITAEAIAEAGINYYMWHLAHDPTDFCDGTTCQGSAPYGPFSHDYLDQSGNSLGTYSLYITPPEQGQNITTIKATGRVNGKSPQKTVVSQVGMPSFAKYTLLVNGDELWVGAGEKVDGTVHVNGSGVRMDGEVTGDVTSSVSQYHSDMSSFPAICTSLFPTLNGDCPGIWSGSGTTPVFGGSKLFPVPSVDFNQVEVDIAKMKADTMDGDGRYFPSSGQKGYHIILSSNDYAVYKVKRYDATGLNITEEVLEGNYAYPSAGVIFFEDNAWVEGVVDTRQVTIVAANPSANNASQMKRIIIPNSIRYTHYDGSDKVGLITQTNILLPITAPTEMEIDAAMIAKNGQIRIDNFSGVVKDHIKVYGSMAHNGGLLWTWVNGSGTVISGYQNTELVIDNNNVLSPPPKFPTTGSFSILSWREE